MRVLVVSGYGEVVQQLDPREDPLWRIADELARIPGVAIIRRQWNTLQPPDLAGPDRPDVVLVYSYGCAALWQAWHQIPKALRPLLQKLFILAGVPRIWFCQFYGSLWSVPPEFAAATSFNVAAIPVSCSIANPSDRYENVECTGDSWQEIGDDGKPQTVSANHCNLPADPRVAQAIISWVQANVPSAVPPAADPAAPPA